MCHAIHLDVEERLSELITLTLASLVVTLYVSVINSDSIGSQGQGLLSPLSECCYGLYDYSVTDLYQVAVLCHAPGGMQMKETLLPLG